MAEFGRLTSGDDNFLGTDGDDNFFVLGGDWGGKDKLDGLGGNDRINTTMPAGVSTASMVDDVLYVGTSEIEIKNIQKIELYSGYGGLRWTGGSENISAYLIDNKPVMQGGDRNAYMRHQSVEAQRLDQFIPERHWWTRARAMTL